MAAKSELEPAFHRCFTGHTGAISVVHYKPGDGGVYEFVSGSVDRSLIVWKYKPHLAAYRLLGHRDAVTAVRWHPRAARVLSSSLDGSIRLWDADPVHGVQVSSASTAASSAAFTNRCHATQLPCAVNSVEWDGRGEWIIAACEDDIVRAYRVHHADSVDDAIVTQHTGSLFGHVAAVRSAAFTEDGRLVCSGGDDCSVRVWDFERLRSLYRYSHYTASVRATTMHPDGNVIGTLSGDAVSVIDLRSHQLLQHYNIAPESPAESSSTAPSGSCSLRYHPTGTHLYVCSADGVIVMDLRAGRVQWRVQGHEGAATAVDVREDGRSFISGGQDQRLCSWMYETQPQQQDDDEQLGSRTSQRARRTPLPSSRQGTVNPNLPQRSRRDALYEHKEGGDSQQSYSARHSHSSSNSSERGRATHRGAVRDTSGCGYSHRHVGQQDGRVWQYEPAVSASSAVPLLHHNASSVYRSAHLHATPADDLVQRLPEQLTGTLQTVQRQLASIQQTLTSMEQRLAHCEDRASRLEQTDAS